MDLTQYNSSADALPQQEQERTPIPDGDYVAQCIGFKLGNWPSGDSFLEFEYVIEGPSQANRRVWQRTDLQPDTEQRGEKKRDHIAAAIGLPKLTDANQAVNQRFTITVKTPGKYTNVVAVQAAPSQAPPASTTVLPQKPATMAPPAMAAPGLQPPQNQQAGVGSPPATEIPF